jgi:methyl-accepting chemotaxis protein
VQQATTRTGEVSQNISSVTAGIATTAPPPRAKALVQRQNSPTQSEKLRGEVDGFLASIRAA